MSVFRSGLVLMWASLGIVTVGCNKPKAAAVPSAPSDTIAAPDRAKLTRTEVTNMHLQLPSPSGLIVYLPEGCKAVVKSIYMNDVAVAKAKGIALPEEIQVPGGGVLNWFYGVFPDDQKQKAADAVRKLSTETPPTGTKVVAKPWVGVYAEGEADPAVAAMLGQKADAEVRKYVLFSKEAQLMLIAQWPKGDDQAKQRVIAASEAFITTVEPNAKAPKVSIFPNAGSEPNQPIPEGTELAMADGMVIEATTPVGTIKVEAGPDLKRTYTWEGATRSVIMIPRRERWYGSKGLYYPGPGDHWEEHNGITRGVVGEGQQHFKTEAEALKWLKDRSYMPWVYTKAGLVVGWDKVPERNQLNVEVWQLIIDGKKPRNLPGAQDSKIKIIRAGR